MSPRNLVRALAIVLIAACLSEALAAPWWTMLPTRPRRSATPQTAQVTATPPAPQAATAPPTAPPTATAVPSATPPAFTLDQKIGQLLLVGINGTRLTRETWYQITNLAVGGVALRSRNVTDAAQVAQLAFDLQSAAAERGLPPLFIAVDQEGGDVARLRDGVTRFPSPMALGAAADAQLAERAGYATAAELLARGINVNLAPVLDLLTDPNNTAIGTRSFGTDPAGVTESGVAFLRGEMQTRVIPVIKHYPGLGGASIDTHAGLAAVTAPDTTAFDAAIAAGAPVVMVGHIWDKSLDPQPVPASLSPNVIARLRQTFAGVILTDSLNMGAVTSFYSVPAAAVQALRAGADWLIVAEPADVPGVIAAIRAAVRRGDLPEARLDEALARVWALKSRLRPETAADMVAAHEADGPDTARKIARRSIAQAGPQPGLLPLSPAVGRILLLAPNSLGPAAAGDAHITLLAQLIGQRGPRVTELLYDLDDPARNTDYALQAALYANITDVVLFGAWDAGARRDTLQRDALTQALRSGKPVIVLGLHTPFDVNYLTSAPVYLAAFGPAQPQMEALVEALFGEIEITGMMPTINP